MFLESFFILLATLFFLCIILLYNMKIFLLCLPFVIFMLVIINKLDKIETALSEEKREQDILASKRTKIVSIVIFCILLVFVSLMLYFNKQIFFQRQNTSFNLPEMTSTQIHNKVYPTQYRKTSKLIRKSVSSEDIVKEKQKTTNIHGNVTPLPSKNNSFKKNKEKEQK